MKQIVNNKICANCEKRFVGCTCNRTVAFNGRVVHKTCKDQYEYNLKQTGEAEEWAKFEKWKKQNNKK